MKSSLILLAMTLAVIQAAVAPDPSTCDTACQVAFSGAFALESKSWVSKDINSAIFYATPANFTRAKPGDVLRWENVPPSLLNTNWSIPAGMSMSRFLYVTEDIDRKPLLASAFALLPYALPQAQTKFRTLVFTHGTAGRAQICAPSNHKSLYYEWEGPFALVQQGYAVIAPDYAGLGTNIPQGFMYESGFLHAADVAYGLVAARTVIGRYLSDEWVVIGHSEGGMTAWRTNERLAMADQDALLAAGPFLGAVAAAPALRPLDLIPESFRRAGSGPAGDVVSVFFLQSLVRLFPQLRIEDYVSDIVRGRLALADQACLITGSAIFANLTVPQLYKNTSWITHPLVQDWQVRYNGAGPHALAAPMLVIQGSADPLTYADNTLQDFNRSCAAFPESKAEIILYDGLAHDPAFQAAQIDYFPWIADRFNGVPASKGCSYSRRSNVTDNFATVAIMYNANDT